MFNLTVDEAHTFYVGEQGWLVHNTNCPSVRSVADNSPRPPRTGDSRTVAVLETNNGYTIGGSGFYGPIDMRTQAALDAVPNNLRSPFHGFCAEISCLSNATGMDLSGATISTSKVRGLQSTQHGIPHEPCPSCTHVLNQLGVEYKK